MMHSARIHMDTKTQDRTCTIYIVQSLNMHHNYLLSVAPLPRIGCRQVGKHRKQRNLGMIGMIQKFYDGLLNIAKIGSRNGRSSLLGSAGAVVEMARARSARLECLSLFTG